MYIHYVTNAELCDEIRKNIWKIPHDISGVICIPRGGLFCGTIVAEFLHVPIYTVDSFLNGTSLGTGAAGENMRTIQSGKFLVIDDSISSGASMSEAYNKLGGSGFIYCAAAADMSMKPKWPIVPDIILCEIPEFRLFEMNLFRSGWISRTVLDIDGVLCRDPEYGLDLDENRYIEHIRRARPLMPLSYPALALCTSRLYKYYEDTAYWCNENNIRYNMLYMSDIPSVEDRIRLIDDPIVKDMKANVYSSYHPDDAILFIESSLNEANHIYGKTGRPVLCMETNEVIQDPCK